MVLKKLVNHHRVILGFADVVMRLRCARDILCRQRTSGGQVLTEATNAGLPPLNLSQLFDEPFTTCLQIPAFGRSMLQFALMSDGETGRTLYWREDGPFPWYMNPWCRIVEL